MGRGKRGDDVVGGISAYACVFALTSARVVLSAARMSGAASAHNKAHASGAVCRTGVVHASGPCMRVQMHMHQPSTHAAQWQLGHGLVV